MFVFNYRAINSLYFRRRTLVVRTRVLKVGGSCLLVRVAAKACSTDEGSVKFCVVLTLVLVCILGTGFLCCVFGFGMVHVHFVFLNSLTLNPKPRVQMYSSA